MATSQSLHITRLVLIVCALLAGTARSSVADDKKDAAKVDEQARAYFKVGAFENAATEFIHAYELEQKPTRLYNAGLSYEKAGKARKASELYGRFLALESEGSKAMEAKARKTALDKELARKAQLAADARSQQAKKLAIQKHVKAANQHLSAGEYEEAAEDFDEAFHAGDDPEHLFDKAEAQRLARMSTEALASYRLYRRLAPKGINVAEAQRHQTELERLVLAPESSAPATSETVPRAALASTSQADLGRTEHPEAGLSWGWLGIGVSVLAAGVAADLIPDSGGNGEFDGTDLVPVALYGLGGYFVYEGVF